MSTTTVVVPLDQTPGHATIDESNQALRDRSGAVDDSDPLVCFLYLLMRDHVSTGVVEGLVRQIQQPEPRGSEFCNGYLATYAQDLARRLELH